MFVPMILMIFLLRFSRMYEAKSFDTVKVVNLVASYKMDWSGHWQIDGPKGKYFYPSTLHP